MKIISLFPVLAAPVAPVMAKHPEFSPLFDGKDPTGWKGRSTL